VGKLDRWFVSGGRHTLALQLLDSAEIEIARLADVVTRLYEEKDAIDDDLQDALKKVAPAKRKVTQDEMDSLKAIRCASCGGAHTIACPRVKRMRFRPDGQSPAEVEFFSAGEWPKDDVVWLEELEIEKAKTE
jgi:hypothetical protein